MQRQNREYVHGQLAVEAARIQGIFPNGNERWSVNEDDNVNSANEKTSSLIDIWHHQLAQMSDIGNDLGNKPEEVEHDMDSMVVPVSDLWVPQLHNEAIATSERMTPMKIEELNDDQRRAYDIVDQHLQATISGLSPPQLLMVIPGEGGVGKTKVIQTITENFRHRGVDDWCVKGAYTGIASVCKSSLKTGKRPEKNQTQTAQDRKFKDRKRPRPRSRSSVHQNLRKFKTNKNWFQPVSTGLLQQTLVGCILLKFSVRFRQDSAEV